MDTHTDQRDYWFNQFTVWMVEYEDGRLDDMTPAALQLQLRILDTAFTQYQTHFFQARAMQADGFLLTTTELLDQVQEMYNGLRLMVMERMTPANPVANSTAAHVQIHPNMSIPNMLEGGRIRIETCRPPEVGTFDGNPAEWPAFRDLFRAEVDERDIEPVTKLIYLQKACKGRAKKTLGNWAKLAENYAAAWQLMNEKYNDGYRIQQSLIDTMLDMKKRQEESYDGLRDVIDTVTSTLRQLTVSGTNVSGWDAIIINIMTRCLPATTLDAWEQRRINMKKPTLARLFKFLEAKAKGRMFVDIDQEEKRESQNMHVQEHYRRPIQRQERRGDHQPRSNRPPINQNRYRPYSTGKRDWQATMVSQRPQQQERDSRPPQRAGLVCYLCEGTHSVTKCDDFKRLTVTQRKDKARLWTVCYCCFSKAHYTRDCQYNGCQKCPPTDPKHHRLLCLKFPL